MIEKTKTNSNSVISLTIGILSILIPFIGLFLGVFGVVTSRKAIKEIEKNREDGRGLANSGLICSSVGIVIQLFVVLGYIAFISITTENIG
ncbi:DUF4190 domain-containing protein [Alkalibacillus almallahensis]|uniref:DUF4190 domain-containing protein n=1 Tax=Alkalibacillus almallahensis TaxID=1379154 RepID=UPI00141E8656|nr:DUF4190 domain-containing protein [Alkalibacillus almallahensis]NIK12367.1 hypothetical protein [Alkalibacillus almallahensis]